MNLYLVVTLNLWLKEHRFPKFEVNSFAKVWLFIKIKEFI